MSLSYQNGQGEPAGSYDYRTSRTPELRRRNRMVAIIVAAVAILLLIAAAIYINYFGGSNIGPMAPLHSALQLPQHRGSV